MNVLRMILALTLVLVATGCAGSTRSIKAWQTSVQTYIAEQGNGDLNALRNVTDRPSQRQFSLLRAKKGGVPVVSPTHTDVKAVLLGHRPINGQKWFLFLVGTLHYDGRFQNIPLDDPQLRDIRVVALSTDRGKLKWVVGRENSAALDRYYQHKQEAWRWRYPGSNDEDVILSGFPAVEDDFQLSIFGDGVNVVDEPSGALWALAIPSR